MHGLIADKMSRIREIRLAALHLHVVKLHLLHRIDKPIDSNSLTSLKSTRNFTRRQVWSIYEFFIAGRES